MPDFYLRDACRLVFLFVSTGVLLVNMHSYVAMVQTCDYTKYRYFQATVEII